MKKGYITYSDSLYFKDISGEGKSEPEAICNACINFMNKKRFIKEEN